MTEAGPPDTRTESPRETTRRVFRAATAYLPKVAIEPLLSGLERRAIAVLRQEEHEQDFHVRRCLARAVQALGDAESSERLALSHLMRAAKRPHLANLLANQAPFERVRAYLVPGEAEPFDASPICEITDSSLLYSLGVWIIHHADYPEPEDPSGRGPRSIRASAALWEVRERWAERVLELVTELRRHEQSNLGRRLLSKRLWPLLVREEGTARTGFEQQLKESLWREELEQLLRPRGEHDRPASTGSRRTGRQVAGRAELEEMLKVGALLYAEIRAELALCTALASDLAPGPRLDQAWDILSLPPDRVADPEGFSLGQEDGAGLREFKAGASCKRLQRGGFIFKRKWDHDRRRDDLEEAAELFGLAFEKADDPPDELDLGDLLRCAAEASFQHDLLAHQIAVENEEMAAHHHGIADAVRQRALERFEAEGESRLDALDPLLRYRSLLNLAQLHFGRARLGEQLPEAEVEKHLARAKKRLEEATAMKQTPPWLQSRKGRQIAERSHVLRIEPRELNAFIKGNIDVVKSACAGKVGLALSGGGFRASFFHLGVLARLAELNLLRHVEILSCVSGGSIVGTHYYLELRDLLQDPVAWRRKKWPGKTVKENERVENQDYVDLVQRVIEEFLLGVQSNIRTWLLANPVASLKMLLPSYSRSRRAGDLFEQCLFKRVGDGEAKRALSRMTIAPKDHGERGFNPRIHNWDRADKVPMLVLNATSLNTGHNWQFTAKWMGESPAVVDHEIDANERLRRMYLDDEAPHPHGELRLGLAVAASACVPGLFEPAVLSDLYETKGRIGDDSAERRIVVRLVDGGVFDNQGVSSLLEQECRIVLVSDASGQMDFRDDPSGGPLGVPLRSNSILMDRIRQAQYRDLVARKRSGQLRGLAFIHLKKDLDVDSVDWRQCDDPKTVDEGSQPARVTSYGIRKVVQKKLADIRTDLDSFCDLEAYALMYSGYRMLEAEGLERELGRRNPRHAGPGDLDLIEISVLRGKILKPRNAAGQIVAWPFETVESLMTDSAWDAVGGEERRLFEDVLEVASHRLFKIWRLWTMPVSRALSRRWHRGGVHKAGMTLLAAVVALGSAPFVLPLVHGRVQRLFVWAQGFGERTSASCVDLLAWILTRAPEPVRRFLDVEAGNIDSTWALAWIAVLLVILTPILLVPRTLGHLRKGVLVSLLATAGLLPSLLHLWVFDPLYARKGRLKKPTGSG